MSELIPANFGAVSSVFAGAAVEDDLSSGIQTSFGIIGYKGKVWSIRYRGENENLMRDDGDGPRNSIEVVIIKASPHVAKVWYETGYVDGSNAAPDCFSNDGIGPDAASAKPQCSNCAECPMNAWGSRITEAGKQGKACSDSKRLAVVPLGDLENSVYGGPMLLRVPAASLNDLSMYGRKMNQMGYPYYSIATRIAFDPAEAYPKFQLSAVRPLNDEEGGLIMAMRDDFAVKRIMSEDEHGQPAAVAVDPESVFEQGTGGIAPKGADAEATKAVAKPAAKPAAKAVAKPAAEPVAKPAAKKAPPPVEVEEEVEAEAEVEEEVEAEAVEEVEAAPTPKPKAKVDAKSSGFGKVAPAPVEVEEEVEAAGEEVEEGGTLNVASEFENDLDSMLNDLLGD